MVADSRLQMWPLNDNKCAVTVKESWSFTQWVEAFREAQIPVERKVLIYFEMWSQVATPIPLKNAILALCRAIKSTNAEARIYISNLLPKIGPTPVLGRDIDSTNQALMEVVLSVNRQLEGNIFLCSMHEHFSTRKSGLITPAHKYFRANGDLTVLGCLTFRECAMRELGLKSYWFDERNE